MNRKILNYIVILTFILSILCVVSCGNSTGNQTNAKLMSSVDSEEEKELPPQPVSFHEINFTIPGEYNLDNSVSGEGAVYYKVFDDNGDPQKMIYTTYQEGNRDDNILDEKIADPYCEAVTNGDGIQGYDGYRVIAIYQKYIDLTYLWTVLNGK